MVPPPVSGRATESSTVPTLNAEHISIPTPGSNDTSMHDINSDRPRPSQQATKKHKRKEKDKPHILHQCTFRKPSWVYFHLRLLTPSTCTTTLSSPSMLEPSLDASLAMSLLTPPLSSYLGLLGSSIPIDILKTQGREVWIRIPRQDAKALRAGISGWSGVCDADSIPGAKEAGRAKVVWRVLGEGRSLESLVLGGDGQDMFGE